MYSLVKPIKKEEQYFDYKPLNKNAVSDYSQVRQAGVKYNNIANTVKQVSGTVAGIAGIASGQTGSMSNVASSGQISGVMQGLESSKLAGQDGNMLKKLNGFITKNGVKNLKYKYKIKDKKMGGANKLIDGATTFIDSKKYTDEFGSEDPALAGLSGALNYGKDGMAIGMAVGGPIGAGIGAGVGAIAGGIGSVINANAKNKAIKYAKDTADDKSKAERANSQFQNTGQMGESYKQKNAKYGLKKLKYKCGCNNTKLKYKMKEGVREILTEDREAHFIKNKKSYTLLNNPNKPNTHTNNSNEGRNAVVVPKNKYKLKDIVNHNMSVSNNPKDSLILPEGTSIVTANKGLNKLALNAYSKGNYKMIDKIINTMPSDGKKKYEKGDDELEIDSYGYDNTGGKLIDNDGYKENKINEEYRKKLHSDKTFRAAEIKKGNAKFTDSGEFHYKPKGNSSKNKWEFGGKRKRNIQTDMNILDDPTKSNKPEFPKVSEKININDTNSNKKEIPKNTNKKQYKLKGSDILDNLSLRVSDINNIIEGSKPPRTNQIHNPDLKLQEYRDLSNPLRNKALEKQNIEFANARNLSAGQSSNFRANAQQSANENYKNQQEINNYEISRADAIQTGNVDKINAYNLDKANRLDAKQIADFQEIDAKESQLQSGLAGFDENNFRNRKLNQENKIAENANETDRFREQTNRMSLEHSIKNGTNTQNYSKEELEEINKMTPKQKEIFKIKGKHGVKRLKYKMK